jgi:hypothetical protein
MLPRPSLRSRRPTVGGTISFGPCSSSWCLANPQPDFEFGGGGQAAGVRGPVSATTPCPPAPDPLETCRTMLLVVAFTSLDRRAWRRFEIPLDTKAGPLGQ